MSRDWLLYLDDIVQSVEKICRYVNNLSFGVSIGIEI